MHKKVCKKSVSAATTAATPPPVEKPLGDKAAIPTAQVVGAARVTVAPTAGPVLPPLRLLADGDDTLAAHRLRKLWTAASNSASDMAALGFALSDEYSELMPDFSGAIIALRQAYDAKHAAAGVRLACLTMLGKGTPCDTNAASGILRAITLAQLPKPSAADGGKREALSSVVFAGVPGLALAVGLSKLRDPTLFPEFSACHIFMCGMANEKTDVASGKMHKSALLAEKTAFSQCVLYSIGESSGVVTPVGLSYLGSAIISDGTAIESAAWVDRVELMKSVAQSSMGVGSSFSHKDADSNRCVSCARLPSRADLVGAGAGAGVSASRAQQQQQQPPSVTLPESALPESAALGGPAGRQAHAAADIALFYFGAAMAEGLESASRNYYAALAAFRASASLGNVGAMRALAAMCRSGVCGPVEPEAAADWDAQADAAIQRGWLRSMHAELQFAPVHADALFPPLAAAAVVELADAGDVHARALAGARMLIGHVDLPKASGRLMTRVDVKRGSGLLRSAALAGHMDAARVLGLHLLASAASEMEVIQAAGSASAGGRRNMPAFVALEEEALMWLLAAAQMSPVSGRIAVADLGDARLALSVAIARSCSWEGAPSLWSSPATTPAVSDGAPRGGSGPSVAAASTAAAAATDLSGEHASLPTPYADSSTRESALLLLALEWAESGLRLLRSAPPALSPAARRVALGYMMSSRCKSWTTAAAHTLCAELRASLPPRLRPGPLLVATPDTLTTLSSAACESVVGVEEEGCDVEAARAAEAEVSALLTAATWEVEQRALRALGRLQAVAQPDAGH